MGAGPGRPRQHRELDEVEEDLPTINELSEEAMAAEQEPPDIENFLSELGISKKQYRCQIKQYPTDGGTPAFLPCNYKGDYPDLAALGTKYGPGKYLYVFSWTIPHPSGNGNKRVIKELPVELSEHWSDAHEEYLYQYAIRRRRRLRQAKDKAELDSILYGDDKKPGGGKGGMEDLLDAKNSLMALGVPVGGGGSGGMDLTANGGANIFALMMSMQNKSTELLVTMMNNSQTQMMSLVTAVLGQQNNSPYGQMFKEVAGMMTQMVDLKQALNPEKQGVVDKIFNLMETVSPQIVQMLQMSAAQRRSNPLYQVAAKSEELQKLKGDQEMTDNLAAKLDTHYGIQATNDIMAVMGLERSEGMKMALRQAGYPTEPRQTPEPDTPPEDAVDTAGAAQYAQPKSKPPDENAVETGFKPVSDEETPGGVQLPPDDEDLDDMT